jgi:hypothetical protein
MRSTARIGPVVLILILAAGIPPGPAPAQAPAPPADARERVVLDPAGRDAVLLEMRRMLQSIHAILQALPANDLAAVERAGRAAGMAMAADVDPAVMPKLPLAFRQMGMQTHQAFDQLADAAKAGAAPDEVIRRLGALMGGCVACHATYRLDAGPRP